MSNELKRVGLVFTEEGSAKFVKTLKEVNSAISNNNLEFKKAQAQWDKTTPITEKLNFQIKNLGEAIELQKEKVITLRTEISNLENAEESDTKAKKKNQEQLEKKRKELEKTELKIISYTKKIGEMQKQLNNIGKKIEEFGTKVENVGNKIEKAGKKLSAFSIATGTALLASAKSAIDFEEAFTGVEKTVDGTEEQMTKLKQGIRDMAKELPSTTTEISAVAEAAGQLGIKTENILDFSKAMIDLGNSTNLTADEAASQLAKFANIMQMSQKDFDRLGSSIVDLGNHFATTEADIVEMSMRLAGAGKQVGLSEGQVLGLATALSSVGIEAEMGGSAISKAMVKMQNAVEQGGNKLDTVLKKTGMTLRDLELMAANDSKGFKEMSQSIGMTSTEVKQLITAGTNLEDFAKVSGMSAEQFKKAWKEDASGALSAFIKGLGDAENKGESAITMLSEMGLTEVRLRDSLLRAANAGELFNDAIETGAKAWEDNTALTNEANKRYDTLKSKLTIMMNKIKDLAITIGNKLMPHISNLIKGIENTTKWFANLSDKQVNTILRIGALVTAIGPLLTIAGKLTSTIGSGTKILGTFTQAIGVMNGKVTTSSTAVNSLATIMTSLNNPTTLAITAVGLLTTATMTYCIAVEKEKISLGGLREEVDTQRESWKELKKTRNENMTSSMNEISYCENLVKELKQITDENGNIKEGYKARAQVILNELNNALGTEYKINGNIIDRYKELKENIDKVIATKKAEAVLNAYQSEYGEAIKKEAEATETLVELKKKLTEASEKMVSGNAIERARAKQEYQSIAREIEEQTNLITEYGKVITDYEKLQQASVEGNVESITKATESITTSYERIKTSAKETAVEQYNTQAEYVKYLKESLEEAVETGNIYSERILNNQLEVEKEKLNNLKEGLIQEAKTVEDWTPEQVEKWRTLAKDSYSTYYDIISNLGPTLSEKIQEMTKVTKERTPELVFETGIMTTQVLNKIKQSPEFKTEAINNLKGMLQGLEDNQLRELLKEAGIENVDKVIEGIKNGNVAENEGIKILEGLSRGLNNKNWKESLWSTARNISSKLSGLLTVKANVNGNLSALPGHKLGLDYVPKDNYVARLHKGERVLTKEENDAYSEAEKYDKKSNRNTINIEKQIDYNKMAGAMLKALTGCKFTLDEDGFAKIVKDELYKVV